MTAGVLSPTRSKPGRMGELEDVGVFISLYLSSIMRLEECGGGVGPP